MTKRINCLTVWAGFTAYAVADFSDVLASGAVAGACAPAVAISTAVIAADQTNTAIAVKCS